MKILLAGATGLVGGEVLRLLHERGLPVRTLSRDISQAQRLHDLTVDTRFVDATEPGALTGVCDGIDIVISTLGAPVAQKAKEKRSFAAVDAVGNIALLGEAERAGVGRFIYLSACYDDSTKGTAYIRAHIAVEEALRTAKLAAAFVRPTGVFGAFGELVEMAAKGPLPLIGGGDALTNPIHERDVAEALVAELTTEIRIGVPREVNVGGPETVSRRELALQIYRSLAKNPRLIRVPRWLISFGAAVLRLFNRRNGEFMSFIAIASTHAAVAPAVGTHRMGDYFDAIARRYSGPAA
ncbi:MAG TPA: NAD(P)H-binding protein [Kofleriaceae bacterium]